MTTNEVKSHFLRCCFLYNSCDKHGSTVGLSENKINMSYCLLTSLNHNMEDNNIRITSDAYCSKLNFTLSNTQGFIVFSQSTIKYSKFLSHFFETRKNDGGIYLKTYQGDIKSSVLMCMLTIYSQKIDIYNCRLFNITLESDSAEVYLKDCLIESFTIPTSIKTENVTMTHDPFTNYDVDTMERKECHVLEKSKSIISNYHGPHLHLEVSSISISDSEFFDIKNNDQYGGAICVKSLALNLVASIYLTHSSFLRCSSSGEGGALYFKTCDIMQLYQVYGIDCDARRGTFLSAVITGENNDMYNVNCTEISECLRNYNKDHGIIFKFVDSKYSATSFHNLNISYNKGMAETAISIYSDINLQYINMVSNYEWQSFFGEFILGLSCKYGNFINNTLEKNNSEIFQLMLSNWRELDLSYSIFLGNVAKRIVNCGNKIINCVFDKQYEEINFENNSIATRDFSTYEIMSFNRYKYIRPKTFSLVYILLIAIGALGIVVFSIAVVLTFVLKKNKIIKDRLLIERTIIDDFG